MESKRFYENDLFIFALLFLIPPLGIISLWIVRKFDVYIRLTLSILFGLLFLNFLGLERSFIRAVFVALIINLLWLRKVFLSKHRKLAVEKYNELLENFEISTLIRNFIKQYNPPTSNYFYLKYFENELYQDFILVTNKFSIANIEEIYIHSIVRKSENLIKDIDVDSNIIKEFKTNFYSLTKLIDKLVDFGSNKVANYYVWTLLKQHSIDFFADEFIKQYGELFSKMEKMEMVKKYLYTEMLNKEFASKDRLLFTYYFMKCDNGFDLIAYHNKLELEFIQEIKNKKAQDFELSLKK